MIEHRRVRGDQHRMALRQVGGAGAELDGLRFRQNGSEEDEAVGDVLFRIGEVLADERVVKPEPVGEDQRFAVLLQRDRRVARARVERHREEAKTHKWGQINISTLTK